ncbi:hypothetical protein [Paraburkholderia phenoliruptrix]|uniref:hypothetical protein n=1 Tax=Paraburkholderia phenoliruptrix TaxID=252970 RepID=UPI001C6F46F8|nr:hypothetical protein [Paraburkholderia phenoliruptrix]MBW9107771.1 hypothetical protein [Paraburkholderia phenoliruptrix]MBW9132989.1 hypothetical protein [Paraburkholderia ginsengiterrae]
MTAGLQIWNQDGVLMLDGTHRIGRMKGMARVDGFADARAIDLSDGTPFYSFQPDFLFAHIDNQTPPPIFTINSSGISWTYSSTAGMNNPHPLTGYVFYGVF